MNRLIALCASLATCACFAGQIQASQLVYNVDIGGLGYTNHLPPGDVFRHSLRVAGVVTYDTDLHKIAASSLAFYHEQDPAILLPALPDFDAAGVPNYHWVATPNELRYMVDDRNYDKTVHINWRAHIGPTAEDEVRIYGYRSWIELDYTNYSRSYPGTALVEWESISFGVPIDGYVFGVAIPEPSTLVLATLGALGLPIAARRKR